MILKLGVNTPRCMAKRSISSPSPNYACCIRNIARTRSPTPILVSGSYFQFSIWNFDNFIWSSFTQAWKRGPFIFFFFSCILFRPKHRQDLHRNHLNPPPTTLFFRFHAWIVALCDEMSPHKISGWNSQNWTPKVHLSCAFDSRLDQHYFHNY